MIAWLALTPLISASCGWCINRIALRFFLRSIFPPGRKTSPVSHYRYKMAERLGRVIGNAIFSSGGLEQKRTDPAILKKITPEIEGHIDHFLRVKLPQSMPVIAMFVGDRTIGQLKEVFLKELESIFPVIMKTYMHELKQETDFTQIILDKLQAYPDHDLRSMVREFFSREIRLAEILGAASGFMIGLGLVFVLLVLKV